METLNIATLEYAVSERIRAGEEVSGDRCLVRTVPGGVLLAVADGLGHGTAAGRSAADAIEVLDRYAAEPVTSLLRRCHEALTTKRGVALGLASIRSSDGFLTWLAVGNVAGVLLRAGTSASAAPRHRPLAQLPGIVGGRLPALIDLEFHTLSAGDSLILATDGIRSGFTGDIGAFVSARQAADGILARHAHDGDDALVLVARFRGAGA